MNPVIKINNLSFSYGEECVLKNLHFDIYAKDYVGIIGPNGGGKTTFLRCLLGFLPLDSGTIDVQINQIGYVPQKHPIDPDFPITVKELVLTGCQVQPSLWRQYSKADLKRAAELLNWLELASYERTRFGELSGGLAQRALLARALMCEPEVLVLDEPMAHVDSEGIAKIRAYLKELSKQITILLVTHDLNMILEDVSKVLCIEQKATLYSPDEVCKHFTQGVYHSKMEKSR